MNADSASHSIHCIRETYQVGAVGAYGCAVLSPEEVGAIENCLRTVAMGGRLPVFGLQIPTTTEQRGRADREAASARPKHRGGRDCAGTIRTQAFH